MSSIFRITDPIPRNSNIDRYEYFECEPVAGDNLNDSGDIRLYELSGQEIESVTHPGQSTTMLGLLK